MKAPVNQKSWLGQVAFYPTTLSGTRGPILVFTLRHGTIVSCSCYVMRSTKSRQDSLLHAPLVDRHFFAPFLVLPENEILHAKDASAYQYENME